MASQAITIDTRHGLSVGSVFARSVNIMKANPAATLGLTFVLIALPQLLTDLLVGQAWRMNQLSGGMYVVFGLYCFVVAILWLVAFGALIHAAIAHDQGRPADIRDILRLGATRALPLFAVELLFVIGVWLGSLFFLVPGIILAVAWAVAMPAVVAERTGVFGAFGRSRSLTKGARWRIFGIGLLALVIYLLVSVGVGLASMAGSGSLGAMTGGFKTAAPYSPSILVQLLQSIATTLALTWTTLVGAAIFIELRHWKDGPDVDRLTEIFA